MKRKKMLPSNTAPAPKRQHWSAGLLTSMEDPALKVKEDEKVVVIKDKYPKARLHYLVLPKENILKIWNVKKEHEDLLLHMDNVAEELCKEHPEQEFIIGYHAKPSMQRLHLHVISTDFDSQCMKTKYHWNSFTTPFFMPSKDVCKQLKEKGKLDIISPEEIEKYLFTKLKCYKCTFNPKNMGDLKRHLLSHLSKTKE